MKKPTIIARIIKGREPVAKADTVTHFSESEERNAGDWIEPLTDMHGLKQMVNDSTILPQCIRAYKNNIAGFGIGVRYIEDIDETPEMAAEFERAEELLELLTVEQDTKEVFEDVIEARETYGTAYVEVIRSLDGEVQQIDFITDTPSVRKTRVLDPFVDITYYHHGREITRKKRFCKYRQQVGGKTVYFKEFGDPRIMDKRNGEYIGEHQSLDMENQANELLEFPLGVVPYGEVRWMGQVLGVDGSRRAERLNNNYFRNGRHTPLMIIVRNGTLKDESFARLQQYMEEIKGENGQHAFMVLETEGADGRTDFDQTDRPEVEIKDLAGILQKDELFQDYLSNNRRKVQSAFQLPDLYVGYTTDFNRATAQTAQEVTEEQVFQQERISLSWIINNKLLNGDKLNYVEVYFKEPDISNPDDIYKILSVCSRAGGLTPNKAKEIIYAAYGETSENYDGEWGDIPLVVNTEAGTEPQKEPEFDMAQISMSLEQQIRKAMTENDPEIVAVMKEVRNLLLKNNKNLLQFDEECGILKSDDEDGWKTINGSPVFIDNNGDAHYGTDAFTASQEKDAADSTGQQKAFSKKTKSLPPKEYAKVVSAIDDVYHARYEGKERGIIQIALDSGYYTYSFEIGGYNNYNIYSKRKG